MASGTAPADAPPTARRDCTHWLYIAVIVAVLLGIAVGFAFPEFAVSLSGWAPRSSR
jgi:aerobic C4-dicarboxylate transport protein